MNPCPFIVLERLAVAHTRTGLGLWLFVFSACFQADRLRGRALKVFGVESCEVGLLIVVQVTAWGCTWLHGDGLKT